MATSYYKSYHVAAGKTKLQTLARSFRYGLNPDKTEGGELVQGYACDPRTADKEFMLSKAQYEARTGRQQKNDVLFYQIRQAFAHGEITPEEANKIGYEFAMRWTKGKHAFFVCTHTDHQHTHNHIYYNSTALDTTRKFRDFIGSARAVRRLSDRICLEHGLSYIKNPKLPSKGKYMHYGHWLGDRRKPSYQQQLVEQIDLCLAKQPKGFAAFLAAMQGAGWELRRRGNAISFRAQGQERFTRLRADTLGAGYTPEGLRAYIEENGPQPQRRKGKVTGASGAAGGGRVDLIVDIQARMREGKGPAYERWAKLFNLKQMAATLQFLQENKLLQYEDLEQRAVAATDRFHDLAATIQKAEAGLARNAQLQAAIADYAKTRPMFDGYKATKYSRKYLAEHEADIQLHREARATFTRLLDGGKLPKMAELKQEQRALTSEKSAAYKQYHAAKKEMRDILAARANIDSLLGITEPEQTKEQER